MEAINENEQQVQQAETVHIDGKEYKLSEMTQQQQYFVQQVRSLQQREGAIRFDLDQVVVARESFAKLLTDSLKPKVEFEEVNEG